MADPSADDAVIAARIRDALRRHIDPARTPEFTERLRLRMVQDRPILNALRDGATCWLDADGQHIWFAHACRGEWTETMLVYGRPIGTKGDGGGWCATSTDPLTVAPSVRCDACDFHRDYIDGEFL